MPPKRGRPAGRRGTTRAPSRARGTPGPSGLDDSRESTPSSESKVRVQRTPGPAKYSTSYGSPATQTVFRRINTGSAIGSIGSALDGLQTADEEDRRSHATRLAAEARSRGERAPRQAPAAREPPAVEEGESENYGDDGADQASQAMPPPPAPAPRTRQSQRNATVASGNQRKSGQLVAVEQRQSLAYL